MTDVAKNIEEKLNYTVDVCRLKKSNKIVYPLGKNGNNHTNVLFPFGRKSKNGMRGEIMSVRNDNLIYERNK